METVKVEVIKYKTVDGRIFDTIGQAQHHEMILSGKRRTCSTCNGTQQVPSIDYRSYEPCPTCDGKGYVERHEVWK